MGYDHSVSDNPEWRARAATLTTTPEQYPQLINRMIGEKVSFHDEWIERIECGLATLMARERYILRRRMQGATLDKLAEPQEVGVTRERIRQIEAKAFRKLRHPSLGLGRMVRDSREKERV